MIIAEIKKPGSDRRSGAGAIGHASLGAHAHDPLLRIASRIGKECSGQDILNQHCRQGQPTLRRSQSECHILRELVQDPGVAKLDRALQLFLSALSRLGVERQEASGTKIGRLSATDL